MYTIIYNTEKIQINLFIIANYRLSKDLKKSEAVPELGVHQKKQPLIVQNDRWFNND